MNRAKEWTKERIRKAEAKDKKKYPAEWKEIERKERIEENSETISKGILKAIGNIIKWIVGGVLVFILIIWILSLLVK